METFYECIICVVKNILCYYDYTAKYLVSQYKKKNCENFIVHR